MESLKRQEDFKRCYKTGRSKADRTLVLYVAERKDSDQKQDKPAGNRVGITVSKKVGNSVVRHRVKRRIRESYRLHETAFNSGLDLVIVARTLTAEADFTRIESALLSLAKRLGILKKQDVCDAVIDKGHSAL